MTNRTRTPVHPIAEAVRLARLFGDTLTNGGDDPPVAVEAVDPQDPDGFPQGWDVFVADGQVVARVHYHPDAQGGEASDGGPLTDWRDALVGAGVVLLDLATYAEATQPPDAARYATHGDALASSWEDFRRSGVSALAGDFLRTHGWDIRYTVDTTHPGDRSASDEHVVAVQPFRVAPSVSDDLLGVPDTDGDIVHRLGRVFRLFAQREAHTPDGAPMGISASDLLPFVRDERAQAIRQAFARYKRDHPDPVVVRAGAALTGQRFDAVAVVDADAYDGLRGWLRVLAATRTRPDCPVILDARTVVRILDGDPEQVPAIKAGQPFPDCFTLAADARVVGKFADTDAARAWYRALASRATRPDVRITIDASELLDLLTYRPAGPVADGAVPATAVVCRDGGRCIHPGGCAKLADCRRQRPDGWRSTNPPPGVTFPELIRRAEASADAAPDGCKAIEIAVDGPIQADVLADVLRDRYRQRAASEPGLTRRAFVVCHPGKAPGGLWKVRIDLAPQPQPGGDYGVTLEGHTDGDGSFVVTGRTIHLGGEGEALADGERVVASLAELEAAFPVDRSRA